ncbi:heavy-metal-associated domain-containing protein [Tahibacter sp.]|uniref:heavy-metal-associated domain-containing protein n=1 Tax=Tahibacter sp. TaxID=2056211 RepID=UPI0028C41419|nr:heavy-metal-associated domain-containing protein [Tahibacter sp.]
MNFSKISIVLLGLLLSVAASATTIEMEVNGLVCAFCAQGIEKTLKGFPATDAVLISLEHRLVAVALKDGTDIGDAELRRALTEAGYTVVGIRRTDASLETLRAGVKPHG